MPDVTTEWRPVSAWAGLAAIPSRHGRDDGALGARITLIDHVDMATLICAAGETQRFADTVKRRWDLDVPDFGRTSSNAACTLVWSGPGQWLTIPTSDDFVSIVAAFGGIAAASEQGDGRALIEIGGPAARDILAKGLAIDLHTTAFTPGSVAVTALSHLSVQIWQADATPTYVLSVPRTVAGHVWQWLLESAAEFGCEIGQRTRL